MLNFLNILSMIVYDCNDIGANITILSSQMLENVLQFRTKYQENALEIDVGSVQVGLCLSFGLAE